MLALVLVVTYRHEGIWLWSTVDKGLDAFGQIGHFRLPIHHLNVDVGVIVGGPGRIVVVIPQCRFKFIGKPVRELEIIR